MSSYYRGKRDAGLFSPDEETRAKAQRKLDKEMQAQIKAGEEEAQETEAAEESAQP